MRKGVYVDETRGKWRVRLANKDKVTGKIKKVLFKTFETRWEAERFADDLSEEVERRSDPARITIGRLATSTLERLDLPKSRMSILRAHLLPDPIADMEPAKVKASDALDYFDRLTKKQAVHSLLTKDGVVYRTMPRTIARQTVLNAYNLLRSTLREAKARDLVTEIVTNDLPLPRLKTTKEHGIALRPAQIEDFLSAVTEPERYMFAFMIFTGIRVGEAVSLHLQDIVLDGPEPHIWVRYGGPPKTTAEGELLWPPTKGGRPRRVPLLPMAIEAFENWQAFAALSLHRGRGDNPLGLAFPNKNGGVRNPIHIVRFPEWKKIKQSAKVPPQMRIHDLRHTCATSLLLGWWGRKWTIEEVQFFLGHASASTTARYVHGQQEAVREAAAETRIVMGEQKSTVMASSVSEGTGFSHGFPALAKTVGGTAGKSAPPGRVELPTNGLGNRCANPESSEINGAPLVSSYPQTSLAGTAKSLAGAYLTAIECQSAETAERLFDALIAVVADFGPEHPWARDVDRILVAKARGEAVRARTLSIELAGRIQRSGEPHPWKQVV